MVLLRAEGEKLPQKNELATHLELPSGSCANTRTKALMLFTCVHRRWVLRACQCAKTASGASVVGGADLDRVRCRATPAPVNVEAVH